MVLSFLRRFVPARSDRRRGPRGTQIDGHIILGGRHYSLKDWSRRGFSAVGVGADHYPGDSIALTVEVALQGERSEEHTSELQSLMRISYAVFCLKKKKNTQRV